MRSCYTQDMSQHTDSPRLGDRFTEALRYAADLHATQTRKGGDIPYIGHLLSVAGLVIGDGGDETQVIAALLHDAAEDAGGEKTLAEIRARFGDDVAAIVAECSDTFETPKPAWDQRKESYIKHLGAASKPTILVSLADKLDNARALLRDFRDVGPPLWERFNQHDPQRHLWYYRSLLAEYRNRGTTSWMVDELDRVISELATEIQRAAADR